MVPNNPSAKGIRNAAGHAQGLKGELSGKTNRDANRPEDQRIEDLGHDPVGGVEAEREAYLAQGVTSSGVVASRRFARSSSFSIRSIVRHHLPGLSFLPDHDTP